jgi:hypothetical protein
VTAITEDVFLVRLMALLQGYRFLLLYITHHLIFLIEQHVGTPVDWIGLCLEVPGSNTAGGVRFRVGPENVKIYQVLMESAVS